MKAVHAPQLRRTLQYVGLRMERGRENDDSRKTRAPGPASEGLQKQQAQAEAL
jgi:hypothetical protein